MVLFILRFLPVIFFWTIFIFIVLQVPYPESLTQATIIQLLSFFIPLFLALVFTLNLFIKKIIISLTLSFGIISFLILKALDSLNFVTGMLTIISAVLLISYFRKVKFSDLTKDGRIPKLKLSNQIKKVKLTHMRKRMRHP